MRNRRDDHRSDHTAKHADGAIDERLIDDEDRSPRAIEESAQQAFVEDQRSDPEAPTRVKRDLVADLGFEDPAHSRGSASERARAVEARPRSGGGGRGAVHADRSHSKGRKA
jgi:hypothetical protein